MTSFSAVAVGFASLTDQKKEFCAAVGAESTAGCLIPLSVRGQSWGRAWRGAHKSRLAGGGEAGRRGCGLSPERKRHGLSSPWASVTDLLPPVQGAK